MGLITFSGIVVKNTWNSAKDLVSVRQVWGCLLLYNTRDNNLLFRLYPVFDCYPSIIMSAADDWSAAFESDATTKKPIDEQTQQLFQFIQSHETLLNTIDEANYQDILQHVEENFHHPVTFITDLGEDKVLAQDLFLVTKKHMINTNPNPEQAPMEGALKGDEDIDSDLPVQEPLRKILVVMTYLLDEIQGLKDIAESRFFRPLQLFGQLPVEDICEGHDHVSGSHSNVATSFKTAEYKKLIVDLSITGCKEKMIGKFLPFLAELCNFIHRCNVVCVNFVQQLSAIYHVTKQPLYRSTFQHTHLMNAFHGLGDLLTVLISLDAIIQHNDTLLDAWVSYKSMIGYVRSDPASFGTTLEAMATFEQLLVSVDQRLMTGSIFQTCVEQNFEEVLPLPGLEPEEYMAERESPEYISVRSNQTFIDGELMHCMKVMIESSLSVLGSNTELNERQTIMGAIAIYALYRRLLPPNRPPDSKLYRLIWSIQKTLPSIMISDTVMWNISDFLTQYCSFQGLDHKKLDPMNPEIFRKQTYLPQFDQTFNNKATMLIAQCKAWMILAESRLQPFLGNEITSNEHGLSSVGHVLDLYSNIFLKGCALTKRCNYLAKSCLVMHTNMQVPLTKTIVWDLAILLETIKAMQFVMVRKQAIFSQYLTHIYRHISDKLCAMITPMKAKLDSMSQRKIDQHLLTLYQVTMFLEHLLKSSESFSSLRRSAISLVCEIIVSSTTANSSSANVVFKTEKEIQRFHGLINKLLAIIALSKEIPSSSDCAFVYFHVDIIPFILQQMYNLPTECKRLAYFYNVFEDGIILCQNILHDDNAHYCFHYRNVLINSLQHYIIKPLCRDIENDLRLHVHTKHLDHMQSVNPKTENLRPIKPFLDISFIRILGISIEIKQEVCHYLNQNFYNLTTVALHDWRTYSDMRQLALDKFNLALMDNFLPMGSLDQGLDVLQIMRNIHIFVSRFVYNMNMQLFIEFRADKEKMSKHCNTIKIQSIAASIRQHGLGVLNTTVNFTYQFLSSKFHIFSQFLFDDYIKAYLSREHRWYRKHKHECNNVYPYDRAVKFVREIRKLGVSENKSFLDQFRVLITEIGNALGYVRMVRSASMYYCSEAVKYLPDFDDLISFHDYSGDGKPATVDSDTNEILSPAIEGAHLTKETVRAAKNLDECIDTLVKNFGEGSDYFKVLVNVFQSVLLNAEHDHLKYFYMIGKFRSSLIRCKN